MRIMVGFQRNDNLTYGQKFFAGCLTGMMARLVTQPIDIVKLRTQLQKSRYGRRVSILTITTKIINEEGFKAFFHGHCIGQLHSIMGVCTQFFIYELTTKHVVNSGIDEKHKPTMEFLCGFFAGCCAATVVSPLEVIRVRQMIVKEQYRGLLNGAKNVYNAGGVLAFYEGLAASVLQETVGPLKPALHFFSKLVGKRANCSPDDKRTPPPMDICNIKGLANAMPAFKMGGCSLLDCYGPAVGVSFSVFRFTQPLILGVFSRCGEGCDPVLSGGHRPSHVILSSIVAGSAAGFVSKSVTYPFDLVKRRLQIGTHKDDERYAAPSTARHLMRCKEILSCINQIVWRDGFKGLYQGWLVTVLKSQLTGIVAFTTYESTCFFFREYNKG